jgi:hypothetical protein
MDGTGGAGAWRLADTDLAACRVGRALQRLQAAPKTLGVSDFGTVQPALIRRQLKPGVTRVGVGIVRRVPGLEPLVVQRGDDSQALSADGGG